MRWSLTKKIVIVGITFLSVICASFYLGSEKSIPQRTPSEARSTYTVVGREIPLHDLESVPSDEPQAIEATNHVFENFFRKTYLENGPLKDRGSGIVLSGTRRGVHPKAHGCLMGTMIIDSNLKQKDQVGIFSEPGHTFQVMARFSNGNSRPNVADNVPDARGFGLKVFGVKGPMLLPDCSAVVVRDSGIISI